MREMEDYMLYEMNKEAHIDRNTGRNDRKYYSA